MPLSGRDELLILVRDAYPMVAADLLQPLLHFLTVGRQVVGRDTDKILLMLIIGIRTTQHPDFGGFTREGLMAGDVPILPSLGINIRSIADSLDMPRETVRRKVGELVEAGWVVREDNDLRYTAEGYRAVLPAREAIEALAVRNYEVVRKLCERDGSA